MGGGNRSQFIKDHSKDISRLSTDGYDEKSITEYINGLFDGINRQIFNTPIDLFIEDTLYNKYEQLRPYQFISLYGILMEGKNAVTHKQATKLTPKNILSASKILNLVIAIQFKELFGLDVISKFEASAIELNEAKRFYEEFNEYRFDKKPGEEYELVEHWGEDFKLNKYFELVNEQTYRNRTNPEKWMEELEQDPFELESPSKTKEQERLTEKFLREQKEIGLNMAVVMFMVDALQFFKTQTDEDIKKIAVEIALLGTQGIRPGDKGYRVNSIPEKEFSGYHLLAYYYVSWAQIFSEMLSQLNLPYDKEYAMALQLASK